MNGADPAKKKSLKEFYGGLSPAKRIALWVALGAELGLNAIAQRDIKRRDKAQIRGPKLLWRLIAMMNFIGPAAYFAFGRRKPASSSAA